MADINWSPDGKQMFEKLMGAVPEAMRDAVKPMLLEKVAARAAGKAVTQDVVATMVQEDLPEPQRSAIMEVLGLKKKAAATKKEQAPAAAPAAPAKIEWQGKSEAMFERMLQEVPEALRGVFRGKLMQVLQQKARGGPAAESHVTEIVNEMVPEPFKSNILKAFSTMGDIDMNVVEEIIKNNPGGQETAIAILHAIQARCGYLPQEALALVSQRKGIFLSTLYRLATAYKAFRTKPPKKYTVTVCNGTGCHAKDGGQLLKELEKNVAGNGAQITLEKVRCLGCCDMSPAVMINGELFGGAQAQAKIAEILHV
jgi:NADH-quinone oxidoreductase subunit E